MIARFRRCLLRRREIRCSAPLLSRTSARRLIWKSFQKIREILLGVRIDVDPFAVLLVPFSFAIPYRSASATRRFFRALALASVHVDTVGLKTGVFGSYLHARIVLQRLTTSAYSKKWHARSIGGVVDCSHRRWHKKKGVENQEKRNTENSTGRCSHVLQS